MTIEFDNNLPIYLQIMQYIKRQIVTGTLQAGDKIPSVRELAAELQINPNTVQRTFQELEREEVVETKRGLGRYVTSEERKIMTIKKEMAGGAGTLSDRNAGTGDRRAGYLIHRSRCRCGRKGRNNA